jgi:hypothetical protein
MHFRTMAALESARALMYAVDEMNEKVASIRARRPSKTSLVIPEVDAMGRLTDLYIAPGTLAAFSDPRDLVTEIMGAIEESTIDAARQHRAVLMEITWPKATGAGQESSHRAP